MPSIVGGGHPLEAGHVRLPGRGDGGGEVRADRLGGPGHLRAWLERFAGVAGVAFAVEACTGWRYVVRGRKKRAKTDLL